MTPRLRGNRWTDAFVINLSSHSSALRDYHKNKRQHFQLNGQAFVSGQHVALSCLEALTHAGKPFDVTIDQRVRTAHRPNLAARARLRGQGR